MKDSKTSNHILTKLVAIILILLTVFSLLPTAVFAEIVARREIGS